MIKKHFYLIHIQYLGFRFHGWAKQPQVKTVHLMIDRTIRFVLDHPNFKTLGTSRTDAMVSANHSAFELFLEKPLEDEQEFLRLFNFNLPADIKALKIEKVDAEFNIINNVKIKTYAYIFAFGQKAHPFSASMVTTFREQLNIDLMMQAAKYYEGEHYLANFCKRPSEHTKFERNILACSIEKNMDYTANFFPEDTYIFRVKSAGFMRNQVRLMVGQLVSLGMGEITLDQFKESLDTAGASKPTYIAPASGLILENIDFI